MGQKRDRKERFAALHPRCCFCGGDAPCEEFDEQPPQAFFVERKWPRGYQFPACAACNRQSRIDDLVFAYVGRTFNPDERHYRQRDMQRIIEGIKNNRPELLPELDLPTNEKRRAVRQLGLMKPSDVTYADCTLVGISPEIGRHVEAALRKLACALYYKHMGHILPRDGALISAAEYNVSITKSTLMENLLPHLNQAAPTRWNSVETSDQVSYRWQYQENLGLFVFLGWFAGAFVGIGGSLESRANLESGLKNAWFDLDGWPVEVAAPA